MVNQPDATQTKEKTKSLSSNDQVGTNGNTVGLTIIFGGASVCSKI